MVNDDKHFEYLQNLQTTFQLMDVLGIRKTVEVVKKYKSAIDKHVREERNYRKEK